MRQPTEEDDAAHAGFTHRPRKVTSRLAFPPLEVPPRAHRVNQIKRRLHSRKRRTQRCRLEQIARYDLRTSGDPPAQHLRVPAQATNSDGSAFQRS
jgi:hypothetical protein